MGAGTTDEVEARHPGKGDDTEDSEDKAVLEAFKDAVDASDCPPEGDYPCGLLVDWEIQLTHEMVGRGTEVTAIGRGYKNGTTLTFWRDANFDGVRDRGEDQLCQANVDGNDIGYCTFIVQKPPFVQGFGECTTKVKSRKMLLTLPQTGERPQGMQTATLSTRWTASTIPPSG